MVKAVPHGSDIRNYLVIDQRSPRKTKAVVATQGDQYRLIEVNTNISFNMQQVFGPDGDINYLLKGQLEASMLNSYSLATKIKIKKDHGWWSKEKMFLWLINEGVPNITIPNFFPEMANMEVSDSVVKSGNVSFVNFDAKKHKSIMDYFMQAEAVIKKQGFGDLVYGKVYMVPKNQLKASRYADYIENDDSIRVFDLLQTDIDANPLKTIVHELGHRYYRKTLPIGARSEITKKFNELIRGEKKDDKVKAEEIKIGTRFFHPKHGEVEYGGFLPKKATAKTLYARKSSSVHKFFLIKNGEKTTTFLYYKTLAEAMIWLSGTEAQSSTGLRTSDNVWLPTAYSRTKDTEWFAEIFAFAVLDNNKEVLDWIKDLK